MEQLWEVEVSDAAVEALAESLRQGPIVNDKGRRYLTERVVGEFDGLRVIVYSNGHPPPHFLVKCSAGSRRFTIKDCTALEGRGLEKYFRNIRAWHAENKAVLITAWNTSRASGCAVGAYRE